MITGKTELVAHIGYPTDAFKAPLIYNPWFESKGIDAVVIPMGIKAEDYPQVMKSVFRFTNIRGALVTMPHKVTTVGLLDEVSTTVKVAGSCNAIVKRAPPPGASSTVTIAPDRSAKSRRIDSPMPAPRERTASGVSSR